MKDIVIFIPGISGSILEKNGKTIWAPQVGAALRGLFTGLGSIRSLKMQGDDHTLDDLGDGVRATGLCQDLHILPGIAKIDGYSGIRRTLQTKFGLKFAENYFEFPYDWRRDNRVAARKLKRYAMQLLHERRQTYPDAKLILIGHSMGGIVGRIFLEMYDGWRDTRHLVTLGTPYAGSFNALDNLCNGFSMGRWFLKVDMSETLSSFTSVHQLLPSFRCIRHPVSNETVALDAEGLKLPNIDPAKTAEAIGLHRALRKAVDDNRANPDFAANGYLIKPMVGHHVETKTSATFVNGDLAVATHPFGGDGTVPAVAAVPHELSTDPRIPGYYNEKHGSLQNNDPVLSGVIGFLQHGEGQKLVFTAPNTRVSVTAQDGLKGAPIEIQAQTTSQTDGLVCEVSNISTGKQETHTMQMDAQDRTRATLALSDMGAGDYRVKVWGAGTNEVTDVVSVIDPDE